MKMSPLILSFAAALLAGCGEKPDVDPAPVPPAPDGSVATVYTTSVSGKRLDESTISLKKPDDVHFYKVERSGETFQEVDGFGLAVTQASCYNLLLMPAEERTAFLTELFSREEGLGSSLIRVCIGGSDFSLDEFTWCDEPGMENFAVHPLDQEWLFPVLDQIFKINPAVKIIASPWSCPKWMKINEKSGAPYDSWTGGRLNPAYYRDYADYFVRWIREMEKRGYPIYAVTLQNEPLNRGNSMSLYMPWEDQRDFIKQALGPAFRTAGVKAKILLFDHNYNYDDIASQRDYPLHILEDAEAASYVAGSAWHNYGGHVSTLDKIHNAFPDKDIYFTEASIGTWNYSFEGCLINDFRDIFLGTLGRFGKGVTLWNLMLDSERKPFRPGGCSTCFGAVTLSAKDHKSITRNSHYYNVAHCSKVLLPGAVRLGTKGYETSGLTYQWYRNPDGSQALLLLNEGSSEVMVNFVTDKHSVACKVPAKAIQSVRWKE
jgi:O-Glycosyl hydrolase